MYNKCINVAFVVYLCMHFSRFSIGLDNIGMTASTLCAIHCAIVPLVFTSLPLIGLGFLANAWVEWGMIILALFIGISSIGLSYFRAHHRLLPLILLVSGFIIIIAGHTLISAWFEAIVVPLGGLTIAAAHFINYKYACACKTCDHTDHAQEI